MKVNSIKFITTVLIFLIGIGSISIYGYHAYKSTKNDLEAKFDDEAKLVLKHTAITFRNQFLMTEKVLSILAQDREIKDLSISPDNTDQIHMLEILQRAITNSRAVQLGMEDGRVYIEPAVQYPSSYDPRKRNWYILAKGYRDRVVWTEPYLDYSTQRIIITAAKAVIGSGGDTVGVIAIDYDLSDISWEIGNSRIGNDGFVMLLSANGTVIANRDNYLIGEHIFGNDLNDIRAQKSMGKKDFIIKGEKYDLSIDDFTENGMLLVIAVSKKEINDKLKKVVIPILVTGGFFLMGIVLIAYFLILRAMTPIEKLASLMKRAENGNYNVYADIKGYDEINSLVQSFNNMIDGIRSRDDKLSQSYDELAVTEEILRNQYIELENSQHILEASRDKIRQLAYYDSLTGLSNRTMLIEVLKEYTQNRGIDRKIGALLFIDLDNFKTINDTMGHAMGDKVLVEVAKRLRVIVGEENIIARIGGDEFVILANPNDYLDDFNILLDKIIGEVERPIIIDSKSFNITISIGVAYYPKHGTNVDDLLKKADMSMYRAKENGKGCYEIFNDSIQMEIMIKANIENGLHNALKNNEFELYYQPLYLMENGKMYGMEALIRWNSATLGRVSPGEFIKVAEETGLIVKIEKWVLKEALKFAKMINENADKLIKVSINISSIHIMQNSFVKNIINTINEVGVNPEFIELEVTETIMIKSFALTQEKLEEIRRHGIGIHLDDFGTGYSSLSYLKSLPIDFVKIDKSFIDNIQNSEKDKKFISSIVELAHNMNLKVIAEGVEEKEQAEFIKECGCDIIQGYYLCKPKPKEELIDLFRHMQYQKS